MLLKRKQEKKSKKDEPAEGKKEKETEPKEKKDKESKPGDENVDAQKEDSGVSLFLHCCIII